MKGFLGEAVEVAPRAMAGGQRHQVELVQEEEQATMTHHITSDLYLLALSDETLKNVGTLHLRFEHNALALLQASRAVFEDGSTS